jgi:hypothetical protein
MKSNAAQTVGNTDEETHKKGVMEEIDEKGNTCRSEDVEESTRGEGEADAKGEEDRNNI